MESRQNEHVSSPKAAAIISVKPAVLRKWRMEGKGPRYIRLGKGKKARVIYSVDEINRWLAEHTFTSTSEEATRETAEEACNG